MEEKFAIEVLISGVILGFVGTFIGVSILIYKAVTFEPENDCIKVCECERV